jgi:uncharacterized phage protein (TIGR02220 family)
MASRVVKITLTAAEYTALERMKKASAYRFQPMATAIKAILTEVGENIGVFPELFPYGPLRSPAVHDGPETDRQAFAVPTPSPPRARDSSSQKEERKKNKKPAALASIEISTEVIEHLNSLAGTKYRPTTEKYRELIAARMAEGATVEDLKAVSRHQASEWLGTDYAKYLQPTTLFQASKFDQYLGKAKAEKSPKDRQATMRNWVGY